MNPEYLPCRLIDSCDNCSEVTEVRMSGGMMLCSECAAMKRLEQELESTRQALVDAELRAEVAEREIAESVRQLEEALGG